ncbi:hypothetical protein HMPREF1587_02001 [Bifidobacterium breve JCP7499]|nr:hypothetical protein HMPREF1587_02001 [Bifidobacterium breve JCP7499]
MWRVRPTTGLSAVQNIQMLAVLPCWGAASGAKPPVRGVLASLKASQWGKSSSIW